MNKDEYLRLLDEEDAKKMKERIKNRLEAIQKIRDVANRLNDQQLHEALNQLTNNTP